MDHNESDSLGWEPVHHGALRIRDVSEDHLTMVTEPQVVVLAEMVTRGLRRAHVGREALA